MKYFCLYLIVILFSSFGFSIGTSNGNSACPSYLDHDLRILDSQNYENLCKYKDKVIMVVNVASRCGFTYQYEQLESLQRCFKNITPKIKLKNSVNLPMEFPFPYLQPLALKAVKRIIFTKI